MLERNKIYLGDCHILLKQIDYADLIIADPPYKIDNTQAGGNSEFSKSIQNMNNEIKELGITKDLGIEWCREIPRLQKKINCYIWCNKAQIIQYLDYFVKELGCSYDIIIWHKTNAMPTYNNKYLTDKEYCLYFRKGGYCNPQNYYDAQTVWELPINIKDKKLYEHPTIKPSEMISAFIRNSSKEGDLIVDPFGGSGTTGECAYFEKRDYILFELTEEHWVKSNDRLKRAKGEIIIKPNQAQQSLF